MPTAPVSPIAQTPARRSIRTRSFQGLILTLQSFWARQGCVILQPYDMEVGAGTFHPATTLRSLGPKPVEGRLCPALAPPQGRALRREPQPAAALLPVPGDPEALARQSAGALSRLRSPRSASTLALHDVRFVEDDWESPTLGAWGLGWECWCDGMEVSQFTYFQQVAGFECAPVSGELTYGLERLAMYVQGVDSIYDLNFNGRDGAEQDQPTATCSCRPSRNIRASISNTPTSALSVPALQGRRGRMPLAARKGRERRRGI